MRMVGYVCLLALTCSPVMAKSPKNLIKSLNKLNAKPLVPSINQCSDDPEYLKLVSNENESILQQCAVELCGKPLDAVTGSVLDHTFEDYVQDGVVKRFSEVENELVELIKNDINKNKKFIDDFRNNITDGKFDFKFSEWKPEEFSDIATKVYEQHLDMAIDQKKELSQRLIIKPIYPDNASEAFKQGLDNFIESKKKLLLTTNEGFYNGLYTNDEAKLMVHTEWDNFNLRYQERLKEKPDSLKDYKTSYDELVEQVKATKMDAYEAAGSLGTIKFLSNMLIHEETGKYPEDVEPEKCANKCQLGVQDFLIKQDAVKVLAGLEEANNNPELNKDKLIICKSNLANSGLKESDSEEMMKLFPEIKKRFIELGTKGFSEHSKLALEKYLEENLHLSFKLPGEEEPVEAFIKGIHENYKAFQDKTISVPEIDSPAKMVNKLISYFPYGTEANPLSNTEYCETDVSNTIWDAFLPQKDVGKSSGEDMDDTKDNIMVSKFSCTHLGHGKDVLAHEMGHAMSYAFGESKLSEESYKQFLKLRACADSHHKNPNLRSGYADLSHPGDTYRTEEDTADLISYMTYPDDGIVFECALFETNTDGSRYVHLSLESSDMDPHSSSLFRALQEATHKGRTLPESCTKLIQEDTKFGFEKCF